MDQIMIFHIRVLHRHISGIESMVTGLESGVLWKRVISRIILNKKYKIPIPCVWIDHGSLFSVCKLLMTS